MSGAEMSLSRKGRFFFPNRIDEATLTGSGYIDALPLANIKDRLLSRVARSVDLDPENTAFTIDFGRPMAMGVFGIIGHSLSLSGQFRLEAANNEEMADLRYASTFDAWASTTGGRWDRHNVTWNSRNFWRGTFAPEDVAGQTTKTIHMLPEAVIARYWRCTPLDRSNTAGFIDIGRVFLSEMFLRPGINYAYGRAIGFKTATRVAASLGGVKHFDPQESVMTQQVAFQHLTEEETYRAQELMRRAGIHREVIFVPDPADRRFGPSRVIYGHFEQLNPIQQAMHMNGELNGSVSFNLEDLR